MREAQGVMAAPCALRLFFLSWDCRAPFEVAEKAESIAVLKGHEFTRADNARDINTALAAEGRCSCAATERHAFFSKLFSLGLGLGLNLGP
jgi:hypothetical protein